MAEWYGHKWESSFGPHPLDTWAYGLHGLNDQELRHGLDSIRDREEIWPPSLPEFSGMCRPVGGRVEAAHMPVHHAAIESDETKARRKRLGRIAIADCRRVLAGG